MKLISHRGNTNGVDPFRENTIEYVKETLNKKFDVEIDLWYEDDVFYIGHDWPEEEISIEFLLEYSNRLWCHAKTIQTFRKLLSYKQINSFFHSEDKVTLTSKGIIWTYPKEEVTDLSVIVNNNPTPRKYDINIYGVCSDYIEKWREYGK